MMEALGEVDSHVTYAMINEARRNIVAFLKENNPEFDDKQIEALADEGARLAAGMRSNEIETGRKTIIYCSCTHPQPRHVGGVGRCKDPSCECQQFEADVVLPEPKEAHAKQEESSQESRG